jgi:hypothetical protein
MAHSIPRVERKVCTYVNDIRLDFFIFFPFMLQELCPLAKKSITGDLLIAAIPAASSPGCGFTALLHFMIPH